MPDFKAQQLYTLTNAGGAITLPAADLTSNYLINGAATLAGSYTFTSSGTVYKNTMYVIYYNATMLLNGNDITIFGRQLTQAEAASKFTLVAIYDGSAYQTWILPEIGVTGRFYDSVATTTVPSIGGTVTIDPAIDKGFQVFTNGGSNVTLSSSYTIAQGGTPVAGDYLYVLWDGGVIANGNAVTIFGEALEDSQAFNGGVFFFTVYNGSDWVNLVGSSGPVPGYVSKTYSQLQTMVAAQSLEYNRTYFVSDRNLYITAVTTNKFALAGSFRALNPDYQNTNGNFAGVWVSGMAVPTIGTFYAYNNFMWESVTGAVGTAPSGDAVNWLCVGTYGSGTWKDWANKPTADYVIEIYACEYDFEKDWIQLLEDKQRGNKGGLSWQQEQSVALGFNIIDTFQWGRNVHFSNLFIEAYLNNVNTTTGVYTANFLPPGSQMFLAVTAGSDLIAGASVNLPGILYYKKFPLTTGQILLLNGTPQTLVAAPGAGKTIRVISATGKLTYNSIAYTTNLNMQLITDTAVDAQFSEDNILESTATRTLSFDSVDGGASGATDTQLIANKALLLKVATGNPAAGNSAAAIYIWYTIYSE